MTSQPTQTAPSGDAAHHLGRMRLHLLWAVHHAHEAQHPDTAKALRAELTRILRRWKDEQ